MTVVTAFAELERELRRLEQAAANVSWAIVEGRPPSAAGGAIADRYESAVLDFRNTSQLAAGAAHDGQRAFQQQRDQFALRAALLTCQECALRLIEQFYGDIAACERLDDLNDLARRGGRDWAAWVLGVRDGLMQCPEILHAINQALFHCWQELTEPIGPPTASAQATSFGARIVIQSAREAHEAHEEESSADESMEAVLPADISPTG